MSDHRQDRLDDLLRVDVTQYGQAVAVVSLAGELDCANVATAEEVLSAAVLGDGALVIIDLQDLEFLDSSGIALFVALSEIPGSAERLRILPSPALEVTRILAATDIGSLIHIVGDRRELAA